MDTLPDLTCDVCGETFPVGQNDLGWSTLPDASEFLADHARCMKVAIWERSPH
jgi:hypothetical protein